MEHCKDCGKLIQVGEGRCYACRSGLSDDDSRSADSAVAKQAPAIPDPAEGDEPVFSSRRCLRCRKYAAVAESEFCLACNLELVSELDDAAKELFQVAPPPPRPPIASPASLMSDLEEKRDRTATSRIRVVGGRKIK